MGKAFLHGRSNEKENTTPYAKLTVNCPAGLVVVAESVDSSVVMKTVSGSENKAVFDTISQGNWVITFDDVENPPRKPVTIDGLEYEITMDYTLSIPATINAIYPIGTVLCIQAPNEKDRWAELYDPSGVSTYSVSYYGQYAVRWHYLDSSITYPVDPPAPQTFTVTEDGQVIDVVVEPGRIPIFTYTSRCWVYNDDGIGITSSPDNWKIGFDTSGTFTFILPNGASDGIDIWLSRGIDETDDGLNLNAVEAKKVQIEAGKEYEIIVGAAGGQSSAFGYTADIYSADTGRSYSYIEICNTRYANINVTYTEGATCTCSNGVDTYTAPDTSGSWVATVPLGDWTITSSDDTHDPVSANVSVTSVSQVENVNVRFFEEAYINIVYPVGARCAYQFYGGELLVVHAPDTSGSWFATVHRAGDYIVCILDDTNTPIAYKSVNITSDGQVENVTLEFAE